MYNLLSLILGVAALGGSVLFLKKRESLLRCGFGWFCCGASLLCQLLDLERLAERMDSAAIYDTAHGRVVAGVGLLTAVTALNLAAVLKIKKEEE